MPSRGEDQDRFACESDQRAQAAEARKFVDEVVPIPIKANRETVEFAVDEHTRPDISIEGLAKLRPAFKATAR